MNSTASECNKGWEQGMSKSQVQLLFSAFTPQLAEQISASLIPSILRLITHTRAGDLASVLDSINVKPQPPTSSACSPVINICPFRLAHLQCFLGDPKGHFKTQQQAEVTEVLARADLSIMVFGPTGEGIILWATGVSLSDASCIHRLGKDAPGHAQYLPIWQWKNNHFHPSIAGHAQ
ncbi:hypothetical protein AX14_007585 [Amanita brunnescens Koide BX004]|nr:hypothetical protein AX14_007585 [Amanita brunnescens Koide BX004]